MSEEFDTRKPTVEWIINERTLYYIKVIRSYRDRILEFKEIVQIDLVIVTYFALLVDRLVKARFYGRILNDQRRKLRDQLLKDV